MSYLEASKPNTVINSEEMMKPYSTEMFAHNVEQVYHKVIANHPMWMEA